MHSKSGSDLGAGCGLCRDGPVHSIFKTCLHAVCVKCTPDLNKNAYFICPVCEVHSTKLIYNPIVLKTDNVSKSPNCNWCEDLGENTRSVGSCKECGVWLCAECLKGHNRMPPLRSHTITTLPKSGSEDGLLCEAHPNELLECFCEACGVLTCRDCQLSVHRDHGSHRWVGEKASLLKSPLEEAVAALEQCQEQLLLSSKLADAAQKKDLDDSFLGSVERARLAIEARTASLVQCIQAHGDALLHELDAKANSSIQRLKATESLMKDMQHNIEFTLLFARRLLENMEKDPASLVQLFDAVKSRTDHLQSCTTCLIDDVPPSENSSSPGDSSNQLQTESSTWRKDTLGWRASVDTRAMFFSTWNSDELARHSGRITWLPKPCKVNGNPHPGASVRFKLEHQDDERKADSTAKDSGYDQLLDSLAKADNNIRYPSSDSDKPVAGGIGCAICFGMGVLAHCKKCYRAYHFDCHLPRLTSISFVPGWVCGLCADEEAANVAHVEQSDGTGLSHMDFLAGCRILMGLLVHAEAVHFSSPLCPACSASLLKPTGVLPHCPAGHLYHRLAELRMQLEQAALPSNASCDQLLNTTHKPVFRSDSTGSRLTKLDDWLADVDRFWVDASEEGNHIPGMGKGYLRAARRLRCKLANLIRLHRPQSQLSLCAESIFDESMTELDEKPADIMTDDREQLSARSIFKIGAD